MSAPIAPEPLTACVAHSHGFNAKTHRMKPLCFKHHENIPPTGATGECAYCRRPMPEATA